LGITPDQYLRRGKEIRQGAVSATVSQDDRRRPEPVAAVSAGSMEAHRLITQAMLGNPQLAVAQETNRRLDKIEKAIDAARKQQADEAAQAIKAWKE